MKWNYNFLLVKYSIKMRYSTELSLTFGCCLTMKPINGGETHLTAINPNKGIFEMG